MKLSEFCRWGLALWVGLACVASAASGAQVEIFNGAAEGSAACTHPSFQRDLSGPYATGPNAADGQFLSQSLTSTGGGTLDYGTEAEPKVVSFYAYAQMQGIARLGSLHAYGYSETRVLKQFSGTVDAYSPISSSFANARSGMILRYDDAITITSPTLPVGEWVSLKMTLTLDGTVSVGGTSPTNGSRASTSLTLGRNTYTLHNKAGAWGSPGPDTLEREIWAKVGDRLGIMQELDVATYAHAGLDHPTGSALADVLHTATLQLVPDHQAVTLVSDSGHDYTTVPEPASLTLLGIGAAALLRRRSRRAA